MLQFKPQFQFNYSYRHGFGISEIGDTKICWYKGIKKNGTNRSAMKCCSTLPGGTQGRT